MITDEYVPSDEQVRWTCEACGATGIMTHSDMLGWNSAATIHQVSHAGGPFGTMPKLIISEVTSRPGSHQPLPTGERPMSMTIDPTPTSSTDQGEPLYDSAFTDLEDAFIEACMQAEPPLLRDADSAALCAFAHSVMRDILRGYNIAPKETDR